LRRFFGFSLTRHQQFFAIALPMIISNIAAPLLGLVDTAIIGHLPQAIYLSAVALGAMVVSLAYLLAVFLRMTCTGLIAQAFGARDHQQQQTIINHALWIALSLGIGLWLLSPWLIEFAWWIIQPEQALADYAGRYIEIRLWAAPAALINLVVLGALLGRQLSRQAMLLVILTNAVNVLADVWLIIILDYQVAGAAAASALAEAVTAVVGLVLLHRLGFGFKASLQFQFLKHFLSLNRDVFIRSLALQICMATMTGYATRFGTTVVAANAVLMQFLLLISLGLDGVAYAIEALLGKAYGQRQPRRLRYWFKLGLLWSQLFAILYCLLFLVFGELIIRLLTNLEPVIDTALQFLPWLIALPLIAHWSYFYDGVFIGLSLAKAMRNTMLISAVGVFAPLLVLLHFSLPANEKANHMMWLALACFLGARGLTQAIWLKRQPIILQQSHPSG